MVLIIRKTVAEKLATHPHHELSLGNLVAWAESAMMDGEFDPAYPPTIREVVASSASPTYTHLASPGKIASISLLN